MPEGAPGEPLPVHVYWVHTQHEETVTSPPCYNFLISITGHTTTHSQGAVEDPESMVLKLKHASESL